MSDFHQHGTIATLHRLGNPDYSRLGRELDALADTSPVALVLPCHARDLESPALKEILAELAGVKFVRFVVAGLDGADEAAWQKARRLFNNLPQETAVLWNDGPRIQILIQQLESAGLEPGPMGKGRNMRLCFGYVLAASKVPIMAVHDCDVVNYRREMLVRLCYPVAHPEMGFEVSKGFSARFSNRLNGRVMRLLITPLLRALEECGSFPHALSSLQCFRYPISGEVCLHRRVAAALRYPSDWGVETGMMADIFRVCEPQRVCQVDIAEAYDHKHQALSEQDPRGGLNKMACDVALCLLRSLPAESPDVLRHLVPCYSRLAIEMLKFYEADARINLLHYDRDLEQRTVHLFAESIERAIEVHLENPKQAPGAPSWNEIHERLPDFGAQLAQAVRADNHSL